MMSLVLSFNYTEFIFKEEETDVDSGSRKPEA